MAGHVIKKYFSNNNVFDVKSLEEHDIINDDLTINYDLIFNNYDYIINCLRCLVEDSDVNLSKAIIYNSYLPNVLNDYYKNKKTKIILLSTDCVFLGVCLGPT